MSSVTSAVRRPIVGPILVVAGSVIFAISTFLPWVDFNIPAIHGQSVSFLREISPPDGIGRVGGWVFVFAGTLVTAKLGVLVLWGRFRGWTRALACTAVAWAFTWLGLLLASRTTLGTKQIGFWGMVAGAMLGLAGGIVVGVTAWREHDSVPNDVFTDEI